MAPEAKEVKGPGRRPPMGPRPKIKNPGKLFGKCAGDNVYANPDR